MFRILAKRQSLKTISTLYPVSRPFLSSVRDTFQRVGKQMKALEYKQKYEKEPTIANAIQYLREEEPHRVVELIEKGWTTGKLPMDDLFLKEYLKSVNKLGKMDSINVSALLALVNKHATDPEMANNVAANLRSGGVGGFNGNSIYNSSGGSTVFGLAGSSPAQPVYVTTTSSAKETTQGIFKKVIFNTVMLVLIYAIFFQDDSPSNGNKSGSSSPVGGLGGGLAGRLGIGGSIVKQAEKSDKTFDDVVGCDEAKYDLQEIVMYLKDPKKFTRLGGRLPKGVLLTGPPGNGKTLLARAIAGEAGVPFYHTSGSEFEEMYVGVGAKRVRELFDVAKANSPCIIFIDEIDAIGGARQLKDASAMKMTLNQLLVEMDGFQQNNGVIVIGATNFPESLDTALVRPGRLDKHVDVPMPDIGGRRAILELYGKKVPLDPDVNLEQLARGTPGFSGAELFNLINQAALKASVDGLKSVGMAALEYAKDKIMMGAERKSAIISPETMKMTAFHEAGHALVALLTDGANPIHKATIMPRGRALGMVMQLPDGDQTSQSRKQMLAYLDVCMGGRVAEELIFGTQNVTSGASSDIQQATNMARAMVTKYGFSEKVGIMFVDEKNGKSSGETQKYIDDEVRELLNASYNRAKHVIETHRKELDIIAAALMEYESISGHEIAELTKGKSLNLVKRSQAPSRPTKELPTKPIEKKGNNNNGSGNNSTVPAAASVLADSVKQVQESVKPAAVVPPPAVAATLVPTPIKQQQQQTIVKSAASTATNKNNNNNVTAITEPAAPTATNNNNHSNAKSSVTTTTTTTTVTTKPITASNEGLFGAFGSRGKKDPAAASAANSNNSSTGAANKDPKANNNDNSKSNPPKQ